MPALPAFIGAAYVARSPNLAADRLVNLYPEVVETPRGKNVAAFYGTPGLRRTHTLPGAGGIRGLYAVSTTGRVFAVRSATLYELFAGGTFLSRGTMNTSSGPVELSDNGVQLAVVDGTNGYVLTLATNVFQVITDPDFPAAQQIRFLDGYFVMPIPNTGRFTITSLYDATQVDSLDFATAEGSPDNLVALLVDHREVWLFGTRSIEVWFNSGNPDFPFDRIQGAYIEYGCGATYSVANLDNTVYWLGSDEKGQRMVWRATGYQPQRISTHAVEFALSGYAASSIAAALAFTYQQEGHSYYVLNCDEATWVYDVSTGLWHQRASLDAEGNLLRHRPQVYTAGLGRHLVGDYADGRIYEYDLNTFTDDGQEIPRLRACPHFATPELQWLFWHLFQLDVEAGVGLDAGASPGVTPQLMLRFSDDGGHAWSNEKLASIGALGNYRHRALWRRLGKSRDRVIEVRQSDPVKVVWINARVQVTGGLS